MRRWSPIRRGSASDKAVAELAAAGVRRHGLAGPRIVLARLRRRLPGADSPPTWSDRRGEALAGRPPAGAVDSRRRPARAGRAAQRHGRRAAAGRLSLARGRRLPRRRCSLYRGTHAGTSWDSLGVTVFTARQSRAYPEHDLPVADQVRPQAVSAEAGAAGRRSRGCCSMPARGPSARPASRSTAARSCVAMARDGEPFFHIYRLPADGGTPQRLTDGPFHDIDPAELPDGRIVFTSTRIGTFEEYHSPPSRALFTMNADGSDVRPLTHTFIFDNEPRVMADGRILFIRSRQLLRPRQGGNAVARLASRRHARLHRVRPGPRAGIRRAAAGLLLRQPGADARRPRGVRLRRRASRWAGPAAAQQDQQNFPINASDVSALPDGRLLCTVGPLSHAEAVVKKTKADRRRTRATRRFGARSAAEPGDG